MPINTPIYQLVIGYLRFAIEGLLFPVGLLVILYLARSDLNRWVNFQIRQQGQDEELREETQEFTE